MADIQISALTEVTDTVLTDELVLETSLGTRRVDIVNILPQRSDFGSEVTFAELVADNVNTANDLFWMSDATDGSLAGITATEVLYGNYGNLSVTDTFTLAPATHNIRPIECSGTFQAATITLDGSLGADQGGCTYYILNRTTEDLTLSATGITLYVDGAVENSATIRENTTCSIIVSNGWYRGLFLRRLIMLRQYIARNAFRRIVVTPDPDPDPEPDPDPDPNPPTGEVLDTRQFFDGVAPWSTPGQNEPTNNWTIANAPTPSANTGPAGGSAADRVPTNGNSFIYTESSDTNENSWSLESPQLDASLGLCSITFDLFMRFGVGGVLTDGTLLIQGWNGSAWSQIGDAITGSQQTNLTDNWIDSLTIDEYDSTGFSNDDFRFRFLFTRGAGDVFNYDCCIDRLVIYGPEGALIEDGGGDIVNRVGIFAQFRGEDAFGPISGLFNTNFPEPEHSHSQVNITSPASRVFAGTQSRQIEIRPGDNQ